MSVGREQSGIMKGDDGESGESKAGACESWCSVNCCSSKLGVTGADWVLVPLTGTSAVVAGVMPK